MVEPAAGDADPGTRVIRDLGRWLGNGQRAWLCTVVRTWGSSPRPAGSLLAVNEKGEWSGSVSGGCLEEQLIRQASEDSHPGTAPRVVDYGVTESDQQEWRLPCGGRMRLVVEPLDPDRHTVSVSMLLEAIDERQPVTRRVNLTTGEWTFVSHSVPQTVEETDDALLHTLGPQARMLLIGAGEVARYVARIALMNGFSVTLCEPRELFLQGWHEPGVEVRECLPDDLVRAEFNDAYCAVLALGHDPRIDDMGLLAALESEAFYIGAMGSQRTAAQRRERLHQLGVTDSRMGRLHAPIGFQIGSKSPPEIAVAAMAQVLAERHRLLRRMICSHPE
jgi:Xanthine and CO dehydrogenases maturation factor, XdhC/CoxF family